MRANCHKLSSINTTGENHPRQEYEDLLISYGHQLRGASFHSDEIDSMSRIAEYCPNLQEVVALGKNTCIQSLTQLAPRIVSMTMEGKEHRFYSQESKEAFQRFANGLEKLRILTCCHDLLAQALPALFATPKPALEWFTFDLDRATLDENSVRKMKSSMSNFRKLDLHFSTNINSTLMTNIIKVCRTFMIGFPDRRSMDVRGYYGSARVPGVAGIGKKLC